MDIQAWWNSLGEDMRQRTERPNWGETRWVGPEGYEYLPLPAYNSNLGEFAANAIMLAPNALGSRGGAVRAGNAARWAEAGQPEAITGGQSGYWHDQFSAQGLPPVPHHPMSSTGLSHYRWYGMRDARTGQQIPNPYPTYRSEPGRNAQEGPTPEAMLRDFATRIEQGTLGVPEAPLTPYDAAVVRQQRARDMQTVQGGRRDWRAQPGNDN